MDGGEIQIRSNLVKVRLAREWSVWVTCFAYFPAGFSNVAASAWSSFVVSLRFCSRRSESVWNDDFWTVARSLEQLDNTVLLRHDSSI